jgi:hypothetical protein
MKDSEDKKSIFYKQVIQVACQLYIDDKSGDQSLISAMNLSNYITQLETQHRKKSGIRRAFASAQPLVEGLMQYTNAVDTIIQADPTFSALIYGGAKLVLQVDELFSFWDILRCIVNALTCRSLRMATRNILSRSPR